jgi:hypothetical protein
MTKLLEIAKNVMETTEWQMNRYPPAWKSIRSLAAEVIRQDAEIKEWEKYSQDNAVLCRANEIAAEKIRKQDAEIKRLSGEPKSVSQLRRLEIQLSEKVKEQSIALREAEDIIIHAGEHFDECDCPSAAQRCKDYLAKYAQEPKVNAGEGEK